jgi:Zn-dependent protease
MYRYARRGITFSQKELRDLSISAVVLTLCFTLQRYYGLWTSIAEYPGFFLNILLISFVAVITAFIFHELAHKYVAQKYGYWAEYRASYFFLAVALACALFLGFVFAAPGAVVIAGYLSRRENGIISVAGPLTNYFVALALTPFLLVHGLAGMLSPIAHLLVESIVVVNLFIAGFNMIPFGNLDGAKVLAWNWKVWLGTIIAIGSTFIIVFSVLNGWLT